MTILSVIKKPKVYEALPKEKIEELCSTENVLDILCEMCSSVSEADSFEIEDIIASAPAFAGNIISSYCFVAASVTDRTSSHTDTPLCGNLIKQIQLKALRFQFS